MKTKCCNCNKEFELGFIKLLAYALEDSMKFECDRCIFDKVFDKLDKDFGIEVCDENKQFKSLEQILSELSNKWHEYNLKIENKSYSVKETSGIFGEKPTERSGIFKEVKNENSVSRK